MSKTEKSKGPWRKPDGKWTKDIDEYLGAVDVYVDFLRDKMGLIATSFDPGFGCHHVEDEYVDEEGNKRVRCHHTQYLDVLTVDKMMKLDAK